MPFKKLKIEKEMYQQALAERKSMAEFLAKMEQEAGYIPPRDSNEAKLDAFERQLAAHEIKIKGRQVSLVEDFYKTTSETALFPEFISRQVLIGMEKGRNECLLGDIIAAEQEVDGGSYRQGEATLEDAEVGAFRVGEGASFPALTIELSEHAVSLKAIGHLFNSSYAAIRRMSVDLFAVHMQMIGKRLARSMVSEAIDVIINGDGNTNPAPVYDTPLLTYDNMVAFDAEFDDFEPTVLIATKPGMTSILQMSEFKDPMAGFNYQATGKMVTPLGMTLRRHSSVAANSIIAVDKSSALIQIRERNASLIEVDKVIDRQLNKAVISDSIAFKKLYTNASRVWDYTDD